MSKVIYIMSEYFAPYQNIGSIKFTKIAKYLSENSENKIFVFCRKWWKFNDIFLENDLSIMKKNGVHVFFINEGLRYSFGIRKIVNGVIFFSKKIYGDERFYYESNQNYSRIFVRKSLRLIKKMKIPVPELILSTYDDWGGHYLAKEIKSKIPSCIWIADFRDPIGNFIKNGKYRKLCDEYSLMVSHNADCITAVSQDMLKMLKIDRKTPSFVVTNGFDFSDCTFVKNHISETINGNKLKFVYTGSFYGSSLLQFFYVIKELLEERKISAENIEIDYAGAYNDKVFGEICNAGLESIYCNKGQLSRLDAIKLQNEADVLLTSTSNTASWQGAIGGKVLEYLMLKKTIIAIVIGDVPGSEIKSIIQRINCGWVYEESNHEADFKMLKNVILDIYNKKMSGQPIEIEYNEEELEKFNLKNIALQYEKLYEELLAERKN